MAPAARRASPRCPNRRTFKSSPAPRPPSSACSLTSTRPLLPCLTATLAPPAAARWAALGSGAAALPFYLASAWRVLVSGMQPCGRLPRQSPRAGQGPLRAQCPRRKLHWKFQHVGIPGQGHTPGCAASAAVQQGTGEPGHLPGWQDRVYYASGDTAGSAAQRGVPPNAATKSGPERCAPCPSAAQSGMGPSSSGSTQYSYTLTAVKLNITDPLDAKVLGVYLYVGECRRVTHSR